jgi:uncharacterized protein (DUF58 family)
MKEPRSDFKRFLDPAVASRLATFELKSRYIVEGFMLGLHRSPFHGFSIEFSQHRPYMQGDAIKDIDWKLYGKTDRYFVKQYEEETNLRCSILLDTSRSMAFKHAGAVSKFQYATMLASALAYLCLHQKDAVGITLYSDHIRKSIPPKATSVYFTEILKALQHAEPADKTNTAACLSEMAENMNKRGLVIVISDLFDDPASILTALKHFRFKKNEVIVFQILDPVEIHFGFGRDALFVDMETKEEMLSRSAQIQKAYQDTMRSFIENIKATCLQQGIEYNLIQTSEPFDKCLFSYLQKRGKLY